jgi:glutamyl-tRNA synthetase
VRAALAELDDFDLAGVEAALRGVVERRGVKPKDVFQPLRVALAGRPISPGIFETVVLLGRSAVLDRIDLALATG